MAEKKDPYEPLSSPCNIPRARANGFIMDIQEFVYKKEDGTWDPAKKIVAEDLVILVVQWLRQLGVAPPDEPKKNAKRETKKETNEQQAEATEGDSEVEEADETAEADREPVVEETPMQAPEPSARRRRMARRHASLDTSDIGG